MAQLQLIKATASNGVWAKLRTTWESQLKSAGVPLDWATPHLEHGDKIVAEDGKDPKYAIYAICGGNKKAPAAPYEGFAHVNFKFPGTKDAEVRVVWMRIAPKYQYVADPLDVSDIQHTLIVGALELAESESKKCPVKVFLSTPTDMNFGRHFALFASKMPAIKLRAAVRGRWLHLTPQ